MQIQLKLERIFRMLPHDILELLNLFNTKNEQKDKMISTAELLFTYMKTKIEEAPWGEDVVRCKYDNV